MDKFSGQVFLLSGAARGLGAAQARRLIAAGATVVVGDVLDEAGRALCEQLGPRCSYLRLDVTREADWQAAVAHAESLGPLRGLVTNAGVYRPVPLVDTSLAEWDRHVSINQTGVFLGIRSVAPAMERAGGGSIVTISSTVGLRSAPNAIAYTATKWAVRGMTKAAALELVGRGIRVNSVHPGPIDTDMIAVRSAEDNQRRVNQVPMRRLGSADEVASTVLFLLGDESRYMTGAELAVDGGCAL